ncbi:DUF3572 domain-containing protein [Oceaniglobus roseus]|uniref:DUF3572 domain-containing protein n=1 Tax=Oceaniglobus roseus TaxID=1737570 RepID=UPI000C7F6166|nr:DUF3572 domain-containing protein [Kandeliimicrobium roseum]
MQQETAETVALQGLGWIAGNEELLPVFLGASGASLDDMRRRARDPDFLVAVLDFISMDDAWVVAFCDAAGLPYDAPVAARHALPGGAEVNWT